MSKNLVIVESPAKAKTIEGYLGKDFTVKSCMGHVRDLPKGDKAIDIANGFIPHYEVTEDKRGVVKELAALAKKSDTVWLATDDDREGEAISWHLAEALGLNQDLTPRIVFREITKSAILKALDNPRRIDQDLVNAQQARRVLDRLVGFELSPVLWKKIRTGLSAGRVQSVAVRLVVEREREIERHNTKSFFRVVARFDNGHKKMLSAELDKRFDTREQAQSFLQRCVAKTFTVESVEKKPVKRTPAAPFTTSTLQQEASRKLGYPVQMTMQVAQKLYEAGKISYMRTDSLNLSEDALAGAERAIQGRFGGEFHQRRLFKTKSDGAQEAHEAIRPTDFTLATAGNDSKEQKLYELIWKRAIASQMADARLEKTVVNIHIGSEAERFVATGEVILFEGFMKVYVEDTDQEGEDSESAILPPLIQGQQVFKDQIVARERFTKAAARYTEASLVKKLEELGIGRPSTYAPTISTIVQRGYVVKDSREGKTRPYQELVLDVSDRIQESSKSEITGAEKNKLFPTDVGSVVNDFLVDRFPNIVDFGFTASVEKQFDKIAEGDTAWGAMIASFYGDFHKSVEETNALERKQIQTERVMGKHPETGQKVSVRLGRYGPVAQLGDSEAGEKPAYSNLRADQRLETITFEEALDLFKLPRTVGESDGEILQANNGRFGPYVKYKSKFYSLPKGESPLEISLERALQVIADKDHAEANRVIKAFNENPDAKVLNGRFGPYVALGDRNLKIEKGREPSSLTYEEVLKMAEEQPVKPSFRKKAGATKAAAKPAAKPKKATKPTAAKAPKTAKPAAKAKPKSKGTTK